MITNMITITITITIAIAITIYIYIYIYSIDVTPLRSIPEGPRVRRRAPNRLFGFRTDSSSQYVTIIL